MRSHLYDHRAPDAWDAVFPDNDLSAERRALLALVLALGFLCAVVYLAVAPPLGAPPATDLDSITHQETNQ